MDILKDIGITEEDVLDFIKKQEVLIGNRKPTQKFYDTCEALVIIKDLARLNEGDLDIEYLQKNAVAVIKSKHAILLSGGLKDLFKVVLDKADAISIEADENDRELFCMRFVFKDVYEIERISDKEKKSRM